MTAKPSICIVDPSSDISGAFVAARRQASLLADEAEFVLLMSNKSRITEEQLKPFARVYRLPFVSLRRSIVPALKYIPSLLLCSLLIHGILRRERCRRLQLNDFHLIHGALLRALGFRGRIVTWLRVDPKRYGSIGSIWLELGRRASDRMIAVSAFVQQRAGAQTTGLLYDPVPDLPVFGACAQPNLVFMGSYQHIKGQDAAITAFHRIAQKHPAAKLLFYGNDMGLPGSIAYLARLRAQAEKGSGAGRIEFRPFVIDPADALKQARAALCMSHNESFGLVCQEASASGIPVIATRCGGPEEIVEDGVTGYLVDVNDVAAMASKMDQLLSNLDLARSLGGAGAALVRKRFPADRYKAGIREIFDL